MTDGPVTSWHDSLTHAHLRQIFAVLEAAHDVPSGSSYRETLVEALARVFGVRGTTFFCGETYDDMFKDPDPTLQGIGERLMQNYRERWSEKDIFALPSARSVLVDRGFITVDQIPHLPAAQREYFAGQLVPHGLGRAAALHLRFADGAAILACSMTSAGGRPRTSSPCRPWRDICRRMLAPARCWRPSHPRISTGC